MSKYGEPWKMATSGRIELAGKVKITKRMVLRSKVRAVACVNAMEGITSEELAALPMGLLKEMIHAGNAPNRTERSCSSNKVCENQEGTCDA